MFAEHHVSHAASAFYPSPFDEAAVLTVDGVGEWATTTYGVGRGREDDETIEHEPRRIDARDEPRERRDERRDERENDEPTRRDEHEVRRRRALGHEAQGGGG